MGKNSRMTTGTVTANGLQFAYETFGDPQQPPLLLVMGLGTQMLGWPDGFCRDLADAGFHVIRFDNRDVGLSTHLDDLPAPSPVSVTLRRSRPAYRLDDLAADTIGLLDALGIDRVHLVGASMGGFISQLVALQVPARIASLTLIMTSTGSRLVGHTSAKVVSEVLRRKPAGDRPAAIEGTVQMWRLIGSTGYPIDEPMVREIAGIGYDRRYDARGVARQLGAVLAQSDRTARLRNLRVPTSVIHGLADPMVAPSGGLALARAIPGARFFGFAGMGHDLPAPLWPEFVAAIRSAADRAEVIPDARRRDAAV